MYACLSKASTIHTILTDENLIAYSNTFQETSTIRSRCPFFNFEFQPSSNADISIPSFQAMATAPPAKVAPTN